MSESRLGVVEREALERARLGEIARRRVAFARLEQVAELEALGVAERSGDRTTARLLQEMWQLAPFVAKRLVAEAADLCPRTSIAGEELPARLPCTSAVSAAGEIGEAHISIIRKTMARLDRVESLPVAEWEAAERTLAQEATVCGPRGLQAVADRLLAHLDPDGEEPPEEDAGRDDELLIVRRKNGTILYRGRMSDPVDGEAFLEVIDDLSAPSGPDDQRELKRRRADGLKDLVEDARGPHGVAADARRDSATEAEDGTGAEDAWVPAPRRFNAGDQASRRTDRPGRALLTITMDHRWLSRALADHGGYGLLDSGARVHPGTLRRWACDAEIVPMVLGSRSEPLDVGRGQRTASDAIRRALNVRDGGCAFPGCSRRPRRCQAHHVDHWLDGGDTALDNMCLLCRFHHQLIHHSHWSVQIIDGRPWFTPPEFIDPERQPRPGGRPRVPL
ncbi:HNH endonuclease signature motif containing protein [Actinomycetospora sp. NBC_00405]|uniref:HNH endonuclease signature motif containing protein n=1 Tax=Actinomycetospora sp. NBC_00405 TaxID=2975952 RepID=UPI002E1BF51D